MMGAGIPCVDAEVPSGVIVMWHGTIATIPSGWALCDGNNGTPDLRDKFITGAKQDDAGVAKTNISGALTQSGGVSTFTPTGTNSGLTFSGSALATHQHDAITAGTPAGTVAAPVFTGTASTDIVNHLHTLATGTGASGNFSQVIGTVDTSSGGTGATPTQTALGTRSGNPVAGGVASYTPIGTNSSPDFSGSALNTHQHAAITAGTPAGTINTPVFTGTEASNLNPYYALAYIMKL